MTCQAPGAAWATVGVLTQKSKPKEGKGGGMFSVWSLADLNGKHFCDGIGRAGYVSKERAIISELPVWHPQLFSTLPRGLF